MTVTIDATGLSCPQPMLQAKNAMVEQKSGTIIVRVDCDASCENISRMAKQLGWQAEVVKTGAVEFEVTLIKNI